MIFAQFTKNHGFEYKDTQKGGPCRQLTWEHDGDHYCVLSMYVCGAFRYMLFRKEKIKKSWFEAHGWLVHYNPRTNRPYTHALHYIACSLYSDPSHIIRACKALNETTVEGDFVVSSDFL